MISCGFTTDYINNNLFFIIFDEEDLEIVAFDTDVHISLISSFESRQLLLAFLQSS